MGYYRFRVLFTYNYGGRGRKPPFLVRITVFGEEALTLTVHIPGGVHIPVNTIIRVVAILGTVMLPRCTNAFMTALILVNCFAHSQIRHTAKVLPMVCRRCINISGMLVNISGNKSNMCAEMTARSFDEMYLHHRAS